MTTPDTRTSHAPHTEITRYDPIRDVTHVAKHLTAFLEKRKEALTNIDCFQAIADVATLYGASEPYGWVEAVLPIKRQLNIDLSFCRGNDEQEQIARATVWRKVPKRGRRTYSADSKYAFLSEIQDGRRVFYTYEDLKRRDWSRRDITPNDRSKLLHDLARAFKNRAKKTK